VSTVEAPHDWGWLDADIETLRRHLGIERWVVLGASWGSVLGLAYAILLLIDQDPAVHEPGREPGCGAPHPAWLPPKARHDICRPLQPRYTGDRSRTDPL
jgi:hypothetical protein